MLAIESAIVASSLYAMIPTVHSVARLHTSCSSARTRRAGSGRRSTGGIGIKRWDPYGRRDSKPAFSRGLPSQNAQRDQTPQIAATLAQRGLAVSGVALAEAKADLADREPTRAREQDLQQDLEPVRAQRGHV